MTAPITEPGIYPMSSAQYHADPVEGGSLSSSGARKLIPPSCPALFRAWLDEGEEPSRTFDLGHLAHRQVLGAGEEIVVVDAANWRTKAAQAAQDEAYAAGKVPVLPHQWAQVEAMVAALRRHRIAGALLAEGTGTPEQALFWRDRPTGIWRRALIDWIQHPITGQRLIVVDYKTCVCASPEAVSKAMGSFGYNSQAAWYLDGVRALGLDGGIEPAFLCVFQEKTPPYLVTVGQPDPASLLWGDRGNRDAINAYRRCVETGHWPGYVDDVISISLPAWTIRTLEDAWLLATEGLAS